MSSACCPCPDVRDFLLIGDRYDGHRHRRIDAAEDRSDFFILDQLARGDLALGRIRFVVTLDQHELRPPSRPPLALISSIATSRPRVIASPDFADKPGQRADESYS